VAFDAFLELKQGGKNVCEGETLDETFRAKGAIQLTGFSLESKVDLSYEQSEGSAKDPGKTFTIKIKKEMDKASPDLFRAYCMHATKKEKSFDKAILTVRKAGGATPLEFLVLELGSVTLQSYNIESDEDAVPEETFHLAFGTLMIKYYPQKGSGGTGAMKPGGWDFGKHEAL
jgi:type VI secretion system secreted protein Hcp